MPIDVVPEKDEWETVTGELVDYSYDTEPDTMILRLRVSVEDAKRALPFRGQRGILTMGVNE